MSETNYEIAKYEIGERHLLLVLNSLFNDFQIFASSHSELNSYYSSYLSFLSQKYFLFFSRFFDYCKLEIIRNRGK